MLSVKISCCILTEINPEFWSRPSPFSTKTGSYISTSHKNRTMKISLFNYSVLDYISPITTSLPHIYRRNSRPTYIFNPTHQTGLQAHPAQEYFRQIYHYLGPLQISTPGLISSMIFCKKLDFPTVNHIIDI